jgi:hypothetical protein
MQNRITLFVLILFAINGVLSAQVAFSGFLDSSVSLKAGAGDAPTFSYGIEEYANLRVQARIGDKAVFYGAFNFIAAAGNNVEAGVENGLLVSGPNYAAGIELERLYFRLNGETIDFDGGLLRLPFGYGQVWGPSDFLNPRNPLILDARPRAVLGAGLSWYPKDELKLLFFGAAPRNPFLQKGNGTLFGLSMDQHWTRASLQLLYSFEMPQAGSNQGIHRAGVSVKADVEVGLVLDALYIYNNEEKTKLDGLSLSFGADYSFFDGNLIILAEYLYNGKSSSTALRYGGSFINHHYLYTGLTWRFNDFTNIGAALISCFDDVSFTPVLSLNHDLFQGATLTLTAQIPLDRDLFHRNGNRGELGPIPSGSTGRYYFNFTTKVRLRF